MSGSGEKKSGNDYCKQSDNDSSYHPTGDIAGDYDTAGSAKLRISSILRAKNLAWKNVVATLEKEFVMTASMTMPGTTKVT